MTRNDFNSKYENYLENRFSGCDIVNERAIDYLDKEFRELIKIPGFKYYQIKPKFGWFDFYCKNVPQEKVAQIESRLKKIQDEFT